MIASKAGWTRKKPRAHYIGVKFIGPIMSLFELEDFETQCEFAEVLDGLKITEAQFCPIFIFIIDWAASRNKLEYTFSEYLKLNESVEKLHCGSLSFEDFVLNTLDAKLILGVFTKDIQPFITDYMDHEAYFKNLRDTYDISNLWFLPDNFSNCEGLYHVIDTSLKNYNENKKHHPKLVLFGDPDEIAKHREEYKEREKLVD